MGFCMTRAKAGVLLPAPVYITVDGEPDKTLATTHIENGQSTSDQLCHRVRQHLSLVATASVRLFASDDGAELTSTTAKLAARFYIVTVDGSALGDHPKSVFRRHRPLTATPPRYPFVGNLPHLMGGMRRGQILPSIFDDAIRTYGASDLRACYYAFDATDRMLLVGDAGLARVVTSDETTWDKLLELKGALATLREGLTPTGLFTNGSEIESWSVAHRILMPAFSQKNLRQFFPVLLHQIQRLQVRLGKAVAPIDVPDLMTRITLDSIAKCGFDYDFQMLEGDDVPPFVKAMVAGLGVAQTLLMADPWSHYRHSRRWLRTMAEQRQIMVDVVNDVLQRRKSGGQRAMDILDLMLYSKDPVTGVPLSNANIVDQLITFLIAGHETTSGLLSFVWYLLDQHPDVEAKVIAEVDAVLGRDLNVALDWKQLAQLRYVDCVMKETLRLYPTAPAFDKWALHDTQYRQYFLPKGTIASINLFSLHRDPAVWTDPEAFQPERFRTDPVPGSYFPFGSGQRACIGMAFALIEAKMVIALTLQRFRLRTQPGYKFELVSLLTIKPKQLMMSVERRDPNEDLSANAPVFDTIVTASTAPGHAAPPSLTQPPATSPGDVHALVPLAIYYGSNMGACQEIAQRWANTAHEYGLGVTVADLDTLARDLDAGPSPTRHVLIVTSTYNGQPPDNAREFAKRVTARTLSFVGVRYAVFGCGNSQWASTFQQFPIAVDAALAQFGGVRAHERGLADANADWDEPIEQFERSIWASFVPASALQAADAVSAQPTAYTVDLVDDVAVDVDYTAGNDLLQVEVVVNRELIRGDGPRSVRHLELRLPPGQHAGYRAGDHFGVVPRNPDAVVASLAARLGLPLTQTVRIRARNALGADLGLPVEQPVTVHHLLRDYLDLQAPLNRKAIARLAALTDCPPERKALEAASGDGFKTSEIAVNRDALGAVLDRYASLQPTLAHVLDLVPLLKPRFYSIASAPLLDGAGTVALTVARLSWTDARGQVRHGLCSGYLAEATPGQRLKGWLRPAPAPFHLPPDRSRPLLLIGPGTGVAPMRSFIRERLAEARAGAADLGPILLVFGCRHQAKDFLYGDEFAAHAAELGPARFTLLTAFSRDGPRKVYVQDVIRDHANRIADLVAAGAQIFVCGDAKAMAPAVRQAINDVAGPKNPNLVADLIARADYVEDIWASTV